MEKRVRRFSRTQKAKSVNLGAGYEHEPEDTISPRATDAEKTEVGPAVVLAPGAQSSENCHAQKEAIERKTAEKADYDLKLYAQNLIGSMGHNHQSRRSEQIQRCFC